MTKKEQLIKVIYDRIMKYGSISSRGNELYSQTAERIENKIYVRKLPVSNLHIHGTSVRMLSIASDDMSFSQTTVDDVRIGCENPSKVWSNVFATECDEVFLSTIISAI
jgi:hypothetical protein